MEHRRHGLTAVVLLGALCALTLVAADAASAHAAAKVGGTLNVDLTTDIDYTDPALDYLASGWQIEYATCLKLLNYPDTNGPRAQQLVPEAAAGFPKVSQNGRTYDFTVKAGFTRFSDGRPVTARSFKAAFDRDADPRMQSPAVAFFSDVVGSHASPVSGVQVKGDHLIVHLVEAAPDFLARVAMPFFCAVPTNLPHDPNGVLTLPAAGPYYIASRTPNASIDLKRNPYYKGPRPHNVNAMHFTIGNSLEAIYLRIQQGATDYTSSGLPPASYAQIAQKYGINKGQFHVEPELGVSYFAFNHDRPLFKGARGTALAKAINYAIDRTAILAQAGYLAGKRYDHILPPDLAGAVQNARLYPLKAPDLITAKKWFARAKVKPGATLEYYTSNRSPAPETAQIFQYNMKELGLNVNVHQFARAVQITKEGTRGEPYDVSSEGWLADYADPYDFVNVLLYGGNIQAANNNNLAYFDDPSFNRQMVAASLLSGPKRYTAYGEIDVKLMFENPPWAVRSVPVDRVFTSARVGCYTYSPTYGLDLTALCLS